MPSKTGKTQMEVTALDYAKRERLSIDWVYRMARLGQIPARRVDGKWLIQLDGKSNE
jgi:hypothetical protein